MADVISHNLSTCCSQEMFATFGRSMDKEVDDLVPALLKKAGRVPVLHNQHPCFPALFLPLLSMCRGRL
jgi:hypothetical protein